MREVDPQPVGDLLGTPRGGPAAVLAALFASLKAEIGTRVWAARAEARRAVFAYITYYHRHRLHSTFKQCTPHETRTCYRQPTALAA